MQSRHIVVPAIFLLAGACRQSGATDVATISRTRTTTSQAAPEPLAISMPLQIDKATIYPGDTLTAKVTYQNTSADTVTIVGAAIAARPPGGTHSGGPYTDLQPYFGQSKVAPGGTVTFTATRTFTSSDPIGQWETYPTYKDTAGVFHDGPSVFFFVSPPLPPTLSVSSPLRIGNTTVVAGDTLTGTVTYQNTSPVPITILGAAIAARPPGGTHSGGPYSDLQPYFGGSTVAPGATITFTATRPFTASDPTGQWEMYPTYQDSAGVYHDGPSSFFSVIPPPPPPSTLSISAPLLLDKAAVVLGDTITGTITYQNNSPNVITILGAAIAARPPGGTHSGGPYADMQPYFGEATVLPGATATFTASRTFTSSDPTGTWETYPTYRDSAGVFHDGPSLFFTVSAPPPPTLSISVPLQLDHADVVFGDTVTGTVTYQNTSRSPITILGATLGARPPGGTHSGGPYSDLLPYFGGSTVPAGAVVRFTASRKFTSSDPTGPWEAYPTYQDSSGALHDGPSVFFNVSAPAVPLGINVGEVRDWDPTQMFADVMKQARHWGSVSSPWDEAATVDANGWPTGDASAIFLTDIPHIGGTYKLSFAGDATVTLQGATDPQSVIQNHVYTAATNTTTADIVLAAAETRLWLAFTGQPGGVKNVSIMRPGHAADETFNRAFLARLKYFTALRTMVLLSTNDNPQAAWADRILPSNAEQQSKPDGVVVGAAWEYVVLLANTAGKDVWINIPHLALGRTYQLDSTDYVTKVAQLFKYGSDGVNPYTGPAGSAGPNPVPQSGPVWPPLNPNLRLYVEFSNELWNGMFGQSPWIANQANAAIAAQDPDLCYDGTTNTWTVIPRVMAKAAMRVSDIFRSVYGDAAMMTQVRPLLAGQIANYGTYYGLNYLDSRHGGSSRYLYGIAGAPYIDILDERSLLSADQIFSEMTSYQTTYLTPWMTNLASTAKAHGLKALAYEAGQTLYASMGNFDNKLAAQTDQRMKAQTLNLFNAWNAAGGDLFFYFSLSTLWNNAGYWGLSPDVTYDIDADPGYPTAEAMPKWGAIKQIVTGQ